MRNERLGDFGHSMAAWRTDYPLSGLGDDSQTLLNIGFTVMEASQIQALHASGALSDAGYNALVSGFIDPSQLQAFLDADPGAAQLPRPSTVTGPISPQVQLQPGAAPRVTYTQPLSSFFTASSLIAGVPNWLLLVGVLGASALLGGRGRR